MTPSRDEIGGQLERLLASEAFANAERASRFLRYVVERTLAGDGDQLKEFVIGVDVFDRDASYDPRIDSIVRVEAGRLRNKLDQYYARAGDDSIVIRIPRGSYVPEFDYRAASQPGPPASTPAHASRRARLVRWAGMSVMVAVVLGAVLWDFQPISESLAQADVVVSQEPATPKVSVIVLPFEHFSTDRELQLLAARFTDGVTGELARIDHISVVSRTSALQLIADGRTLRDIARTVDAQVVVEGSLVVEGSRAHADVRLVDTVVDRKSWSRQFAADVSDLRALQQQVAAAVAAFIAQPPLQAERP
jgi:TolB-like protein